MRPLIIGPEAKAEAARVRAHAEANHYHLGQATPGDDPRYVARLGTYRAVFTVTHVDGLLYRHLSVSVPSKKYPNPAAVFMIADLFGFTGWSPDAPFAHGDEWIMNVHKQEHCVVVAQPIATDTTKVLVN